MVNPDVERSVLGALPKYMWMWGDVKHRRGQCTACGEMCNLSPECLNITPGYVMDDPYMDDFDEDIEASGNSAYVPDDPTGKRAIARAQNGSSEDFGDAKHLHYGYCPSCGAAVQYRRLNAGRKHLEDKVFFVRYGKSAIDPNVVVCVGFAVYVPWAEMDELESIEPPMHVIPMEICLFEYGRGAWRFVRREDTCIEPVDERRVCVYKAASSTWIKRRECHSGYSPGNSGWAISYQTVLDNTSFNTALRGTGFERVIQASYSESSNLNMIADAGVWKYYDRISALARMAKYPCVEYLYRLGYYELGNRVLDNNIGRLLNLRGKTAAAVLRLTDNEWGQVKGKQICVTWDFLSVLDSLKSAGLKVNMELCEYIARSHELMFGEQLDTLIKCRGLDAIAALKYCRRRDVRLHDYCDYVRELQELRMDVGDKSLAYPSDFQRMHEQLSARIQHRKDAGIERKIRAWANRLGEYCFSAYGLTLRPMLSSREIVDEGTALHHCVGGYVKRYADSGTVLCALREDTAPGTPWHTVEFSAKNGVLIQCRGDHNRTKPEDEERLERFWQLFESLRGELRAAAKAKETKKRLRDSARKVGLGIPA